MAQESIGGVNTGKVLGTINSFGMIAQVIAPIVGGALYNATGMLGVFIISLGALTIDLVLRLLVMETNKDTSNETNETPQDNTSRTCEPESWDYITENRALLPKANDTAGEPDGDIGPLVQAIPVLYCCRHSRFVIAMVSTATATMFIGMLHATIPTEASRFLHFSPLQVGFLFMAFVAPCSLCGWFVGWAVDKYGTKIVATVGFMFLAFPLAVLGLPFHEFVAGHAKAGLFSIILLLNGIGLSIVILPSFVEASSVLQSCKKANSNVFGAKSSYAQLFGFHSAFFFLGLAVGPILGLPLTKYAGYTGTGIGFAFLSGVMAVLSFLFIGVKKETRHGRM
ncbi:uncharacterized protein LW93_4824 [Fusarium fujikuroi]|nr:uncharacterized protein LW93_4824 [Fusarium fujikuroi]